MDIASAAGGRDSSAAEVSGAAAGDSATSSESGIP